LPQDNLAVKEIVMMGGSINHGYGQGFKPAAEFNIAQDPSSARIVFESGVLVLTAPLNVTAMLQLDAVARERSFGKAARPSSSIHGGGPSD
jgi:inosine-uridine nucleoside N-ribohydrolase